jgi:hypothetical protein
MLFIGASRHGLKEVHIAESLQDTVAGDSGVEMFNMLGSLCNTFATVA